MDTGSGCYSRTISGTVNTSNCFNSKREREEGREERLEGILALLETLE